MLFADDGCLSMKSFQTGVYNKSSARPLLYPLKVFAITCSFERKRVYSLYIILKFRWCLMQELNLPYGHIFISVQAIVGCHFLMAKVSKSFIRAKFYFKSFVPKLLKLSQNSCCDILFRHIPDSLNYLLR